MLGNSNMARIVADVRVGDALDGLYLGIRERERSADLLTRLKRHAGDMPLRRSASGIFIPFPLAGQLDQIDGIDLRWTSEARQFVANRVTAGETFHANVEALHRLKAAGPIAARHEIADSDGLNILDAHQVVNVAAMTAKGGLGLCVFDEQGAGKTVTLIFAFDLLASRNEADRVLIIAPKSMVPEWPKDIARFRPDLYRVAIVSGSAREKRRILQEDPDVIVTNFETALSMEVELTALLRSRPGRTVLAVDESFFIKSLDAQRTRAIRRLREWCGRAFVLCGTPAPNSPRDLVQQFSLVDFGLAFDGVDVPQDRTEAAPVVQEVIEKRGLFIRHLKAQVLPDLPSKSFQRIFVPLAPEQGRLYGQLLNDLVADVEKTDERQFGREFANFLARRSALLQLCSNPSAIFPEYQETPAKLAALDALVDQLVAAGEKIVIWSFYTKSVSRIVERYARHGAMRYDGEVSDVDTRRDTVRRFQDDDCSMILVANPAAAGAGLTLHRARIAIYESLSNQAAHYLQSLDRIHRRGQTRDVEYLVLLGDKTIETQEYERLIAKEAASQSLLGDVVSQPVTRDTFLGEAKAAIALFSANAASR
ncbi:DEAD/DEAH box helicase [Sphingomonas sp. KR3-1]|uniref:DEAD/DEAH box helicase n=1 Tax=Sphingomonas sp. KR3-1 TaxID=3156611 RepID=UPI0032B510EE